MKSLKSNRRWMALTQLLVTVTAVLVTCCYCDDSTLSLSKSPWMLGLQRFQREKLNKRSKKQQQLQKRKDACHEASLFTLREPSVEHVSEWFWETQSSVSSARNSNPVSNHNSNSLFNHEWVGITNPCLHISITATEATTMKSSKEKVIIPVVSRTSHGSTDRAWWPSTAVTNDAGNIVPCSPQPARQEWRVLRYRSRVGHGWDCYQAVRNAALAWEFQSQQDGLIQVQPPSAIAKTNRPRQRRNKRLSRNPFGKDTRDVQRVPSLYGETRRGYIVLPATTETSAESEQGQQRLVEGSRSNTVGSFENVYEPMRSDRVLQIWSGPGRKLVTYTQQGLLQLAPRLRLRLTTLNPVYVIYDLVDRPGPAGTVFTATAYATGKGHLIAGEERVTVAFRPDDNNAVDVEILSFSKPNTQSRLGRVAWPFIGGMQHSFFESQMRHFERVGAISSSSSSSSSPAAESLSQPPMSLTLSSRQSQPFLQITSSSPLPLSINDDQNRGPPLFHHDGTILTQR